jgi:hypothetical protein
MWMMAILLNAQVRVQTEKKDIELPSNVTKTWWETVQKQIRESEYEIKPRAGGGYTSPNRAQNLRFVYEEKGFVAKRRDSLAHLWQAKVEYIGISKDKSIKREEGEFELKAEGKELVAKGKEVWIKYHNDEKGMRQDFEVKHKPRGDEALRVWLGVEMKGGRVEVEGEAISFIAEGGAEVMRYSDLKVWDGNERRLKAWFERVDERNVAIVVDEKNAAYPIVVDPLSTSASWTAESNQGSASFGFSVGTAGDVNGDGYSDVIVGAPFYDNGETYEGRAYVYHGSASGLSGTAAWTAESNQGSAFFGFSVGTAGDVNGDGYSDVIVGAYLYDNGETDEGRAYVYHGSASGLSGTAAWTAESNQANAYFGYSVGTAGDVNGDGYSDVIVGAYYYDNGETDEGRAYVYYGNAGGGMRQDLQQLRPTDDRRIIPALKTGTVSSVKVGKREKSIAGRNRTRLEIEVKPLGTPFNGMGLVTSGYGLHDVDGTISELTVSGLSNRTMYKWRVRQAVKPSEFGYMALPRSRWYYPSGIGGNESHFQVSNDDLPLPVELVSFTGTVEEGGVRLSWVTASEVDNLGFEVRRSENDRDYETIASYREYAELRGRGTSTDGGRYGFVDGQVEGGKTYMYRLRSVDYSGTVCEYEPIVSVSVKVEQVYSLMQNYPNPFNPETTIRFRMKVSGLAILTIRDVLGRVVRQERIVANVGENVYRFVGTGLSSGVYFYTLEAGNFRQTKKMLLMK